MERIILQNINILTLNKLERQERQQQEWERYKMSSVLRSTLNDEEEVVHEIKCGTCNGISEEGELHFSH